MDADSQDGPSLTGPPPLRPPLRPRGRPKDPTLESRRRGEFLAIAARTFAERGYADTDMQQIANLAGVGKGTLYRYFPGKEELFFAAVDQGLTELLHAVDEAVAGGRPPLARLEAALRSYLAFFARRPEMVELFIQERAAFRHRHQPLYFSADYCPGGPDSADPKDDFTRELLASGLVRPHTVEEFHGVIGDLLFGTVISNSLSGRPVDREQQAAAVVGFVMHGVLSDAGRQVYRSGERT